MIWVKSHFFKDSWLILIPFLRFFKRLVKDSPNFTEKLGYTNIVYTWKYTRDSDERLLGMPMQKVWFWIGKAHPRPGRLRSHLLFAQTRRQNNGQAHRHTNMKACIGRQMANANSQCRGSIIRSLFLMTHVWIEFQKKDFSSSLTDGMDRQMSFAVCFVVGCRPDTAEGQGKGLIIVMKSSIYLIILSFCMWRGR